MDFVLFLLVNAVLFLRPQDLFSFAAGVPVYNILIVANLVVALPAILGQLRYGLRRLPATVCVLALLAAIVLSLVSRGDVAGAWYSAIESLKLLAYFVLMTAVLTSTRRLSVYLSTIVILTIALTSVSIADYHGQIDVPTIKHTEQAEFDQETGQYYKLHRLAALGMFADPNDLSMIVVLSILLCLGGLAYKQLGATRFALVAPLAILAYALALTQSRGGLLALLAGVSILLISRYGVSRSTVAIAIAVPTLMVLFGGRQADISGGIAYGTGSQRTEMWYLGLQMMKWAPVFGMGHGSFVKEGGYVAHNTYVQALAELGPLGGAAFIGLFYVAIYSVWRLRSVRRKIASPMLRALQPYILGAVAAYAVSMLTLSRGEVVPTYLVAGLGVSYGSLARRGTPLRPLEFTPALVRRIVLVTAGFIVLLYVYIRFIYRLF